MSKPVIVHLLSALSEGGPDILGKTLSPTLKDSYPQYLAWAIQLARPGSIIVADNCVQGGNGLHVQEAANPRYAGIRAYNQNASSNPALCSIALPVNTGMTISGLLDRREQE